MGRFRQASNFFQYLYFMRFSVLLWATLIFLPVLDLTGLTTPITRGMFALEYGQGISKLGQFVWAGFYVFLAGWIALLSARLVAAYGEERFDAVPPRAWQVPGLQLVPHDHRLTLAPADQGQSMRPAVFWGAQIPGALFLLYTIGTSIHESSGAGWGYVTDTFGVLLGAFFALIAWYMIAFIYYFRRAPTSGANANSQYHSFFLPHINWRWLREPLELALGDDASPPLDKTADRLMRRVAMIGPGYDRTGGTDLHSGQAMAIQLAVLLLMVYFTRGLARTPVPFLVFWQNHPGVVIIWGLIALLLVVPFAILTAGATFFSRSTKEEPHAYRWRVFGVLLVAGVSFGILVHGAPFPVLFTVFSLVMSFCWIGANLAFFADRSRIPVVTSMLLLVLLGTWVFDQGHIYRTIEDKNKAAVSQMLMPNQVIDNFRNLHLGEPMIVVTASGGGIHAAAWTATVLDGLEKGFGDAGFHQHILLMSSVSGGSVATSYWAESYLDATNPKTSFDVSTIKDMAQSSSLEDAAWGVLYPDLNHFLVWKDVVFPWLREYDRGWALQEAFEQIRSKYRPCNNKKNNGERPCFAGEYTLGALRDHLLSSTDPTGVPAFAFNTTLAGLGQRFLLSNYRLPKDPPEPETNQANACPPPAWHAPNFLTFYPGLDITLFTAARLSATFSYVSPVAAAMRPDRRVMNERFADGGYYDNDGMATALEFLSSAYSEVATQEVNPLLQKAPPGKPEPQVKKPAPPKLDTIFLIEIRHSDLNHPLLSASMQPPARPPLGQVAAQVIAPISTVFGAWDTAQGLRNQQEFALLKSALRGKVEFQHFIFTCFDEQKRASPLSWRLTEREKQAIDGEWRSYQKAVVRLVNCFKASMMSHAAATQTGTQQAASQAPAP